MKLILLAILATICGLCAATTKETEETGNGGKFDEIMTQCCTAGEDHASEEENCRNFKPPAVKPEMISACLYSSEICCATRLRINRCKAGVLSAKDGLDCHSPTNETGSEFYKNCCEACKVGLILGAMQESCTMELQYGSPFDDSFNFCCNEMKATDDTIVLSEDMDLCSKQVGLCEQICVDTGESKVLCKCEPGYRLKDDKRSCEKISNDSDESDIDTATPNASDDCPNGYSKNENTGECEDIDECEGTDVTCDMETQVCHNTKGSYKCLDITPVDNAPTPTCPNGYQFDTDIKQCVDINECETKLGLRTCGSNRECVNTQGGYECADKVTKKVTTNPRFSSDSTTRKPLTCTKGYQQQGDKCVDIDECATDRNSCDSNQNCINMAGTFQCECKTGFKLDKALNACVDINECQINNHDCTDTQRCDNTIGSYTCIRLQSCGTGYTLNAETGHCDDDDECILNRHNCVAPYVCRNTKGSFRCDRPRYTTTTPAPTTSTTTVRTTTTPRPYKHTNFYTTSPRRYVYTAPLSRYTSPTVSTSPHPGRQSDWDTRYGPCPLGFHRSGQGACVDIDECNVSNPCRRNQRCQNTNGSYKCVSLLTCSGGFTSNDEGTQCIDVDECETRTANCGPDEICRNKPGGYTCSCPVGHTLNAQRRCEDINECEFYRGQVCPGNSECLNTVGSYRCECKDGFKRHGNDEKSCIDVDECAETPGLCSQRCINYWGSYRCACETGYHLSVNNRTCEDIDECEVHKSSNLCMGMCQNTHGSYQCACPAGYRLASDNRSCQDVDECSTGICNGYNEICTNIKGSYKCTQKYCPSDYINDPNHKNRCKRISLTCEQGDTECYRRPMSYTFHFITLVSNLSLPPQGRALFTLKGPSWYENIDFDMTISNTQAPSDVRRANHNYFHMEKFHNEARLSLMQTLEGPQDIELEMSMTVFKDGQPSGTSVAKLFIFVSEFPY